MAENNPMLLALLIDAALWLITLIASTLLVRMMYRRRDLTTRLFLGIAVALAVPQVLNLLKDLVNIGIQLFPTAPVLPLAGLLNEARPISMAAVILSSCFIWHLALVFPTRSVLMERWPWLPLVFYVPGLLFAGMMVSRLGMGEQAYLGSWGLRGVKLAVETLQIFFVVAAAGSAILRLAWVSVTTGNRLTRQQLTWLLWGMGAGGLVLLATHYVPQLFGLPVPADAIPGVRQLPALIMIAALALSMMRYQVLDVELVVSRSLAYGVLAVIVTLLYLSVATILVELLSKLTEQDIGPFVAVVTTLTVVLVALPARDAIQRAMDRAFLRTRRDYQELLRAYSRRLTSLVALPDLLATVADQVEAVFHPAGLAIVLASNDATFRVALCRGRPAGGPHGSQGSTFDRGHFIPVLLAGRLRPFYVPLAINTVPAAQRAAWLALQRDGAELFVPMALHESLAGWLVLGPRLADLPYVRQDTDFLTALADQSCMAIDNARLYSAMQQRATELAMVSMVSSTISSSLDVEYVLQTIVESILHVIGCDKSALFEMDEDGRELSLRMAKGLSDAYVAHSLHLAVGSDPRALAVARKMPIIVPDIEEDVALAALRPLAREEGYRAVTDMPLIGHQGEVGVLSVYFADVHTPSPNEMEILTTFASQAAVAIENARLYAAVSRERDRATRLYEQTDAALARRVEELTAIEEISRQLTGALDLHRVMSLVLERALKAVPANRGGIALYDREQHGLKLLAQAGYSQGLERYRSEELWSDEQGITGRVARTGIMAWVPDVSRDPDYRVKSDATAAQLSVPIIHDQQVIGVITLESDGKDLFAPEHVRFVQVVAEHAAIAMHNAQLFAEVMEGRDRLQAVLNSTRDAVLVLDTTGQVILANPGVRALLGRRATAWLWKHSPLDVEALQASELIKEVEPDAEGLLAAMRQIEEQSDRVADFAFSFQEEGWRRYVEATSWPVLSAGSQLLGRVTIMRDVTSQHELESFRDELTSMLVHNLQGPLAAIISSLEMLRDDYALGTNEANELIRIGLTSGRRLSVRIESLLKIRQLEEKQVPLDIHPVPLPYIVQPVLLEYRPTAAAGHVGLEAHFAPDLPSALVDEEIVSRVFSNLLDNALKYTSGGGQITVCAGQHEQDGRPCLLCAVVDTGCGISEDVRGTIFGRFRRGPRPARGRRMGSGIGLHYCRLAVEAHGGKIWVDSQVGVGSSFYFTLPVAAGGELAAGD